MFNANITLTLVINIKTNQNVRKPWQILFSSYDNKTKKPSSFKYIETKQTQKSVITNDPNCNEWIQVCRVIWRSLIKNGCSRIFQFSFTPFIVCLNWYFFYHDLALGMLNLFFFTLLLSHSNLVKHNYVEDLFYLLKVVTNSQQLY